MRLILLLLLFLTAYWLVLFNVKIPNALLIFTKRNYWVLHNYFNDCNTINVFKNLYNF